MTTAYFSNLSKSKKSPTRARRALLCVLNQGARRPGQPTVAVIASRFLWPRHRHCTRVGLVSSGVREPASFFVLCSADGRVPKEALMADTTSRPNSSNSSGGAQDKDSTTAYPLGAAGAGHGLAPCGWPRAGPASGREPRAGHGVTSCGWPWRWRWRTPTSRNVQPAAGSSRRSTRGPGNAAWWRATRWPPGRRAPTGAARHATTPGSAGRADEREANHSSEAEWSRHHTVADHGEGPRRRPQYLGE